MVLLWQATTAWLPVVSIGPATPTTEVFTPVKERDGEIWVARGWRLGMTAWAEEDEEWVARPSTPPAVDSSASRDARVLAYEVWNCLLICMLSHEDCARALFD